MRNKLAILIIALLVAIPAHAVKNVDIYTRSVPNGQNGVAYSATVKAKFGTKPYTWSIGSGALPTGFNVINSATGEISGTSVVNGTYNFVVHVVDSAGSPTSDNQSLHITISGSAPAPAPAVSITTGSLPAGIVGGAYNTTLQASGGTPPYTWSIPADCLAPNCALPPPLTLTGATGTIAGTPTASGTYSFNARVTDSSATPQTATRAFVITVAEGTPTFLFSDPLSGSFAAWGYVNNASQNNPTTASCPGGGNCAQFHYNICGDSTNPACGASHQDLNRWLSKVFTTGLTDPFMRAYVYFKTPEPGASAFPIQRKQFWISDSLSAGDSLGTWSHGLTSDSTVAGISLRVFANGSCGNVPTSYFPTGTLNYNTFYSIEIESKLNTPGLSDGEIRVWVDGVLKLNQAGVNQRGTCTTDAHFFSIGRQSDRNNYLVVDEYRYWKNLVINSTGPIGP